MRRYECFRRRERFLGVLVFAKLIRISIADILVVSVITRARCKTEPKAPPALTKKIFYKLPVITTCRFLFMIGSLSDT